MSQVNATASTNTAPTFTVGYGDGKVTTALGSMNDGARCVTLQADGKILVAGETVYDGTTGFGLVRYNSNGTLDLSFDVDGKVTTYINNYNFASSITMQADGKILVAGSSDASNSYDFALVRYNSDGSLDSSFDGDGKVTTDFGNFDDSGLAVTVQTDGKILVAGYSRNGGYSDFALVRYNSDGSLDTSFDGDGKVTTDLGGAYYDFAQSVIEQTDGKILVAGGLSLVRYNSDGSLDTSFDGDGKITTTTTLGWRSVTLQADGKILVAGTSYASNRYDFALARYNSDGSLDSSFNGTGIVITDFGSFDDSGSSVTVQADGKILVVGTSQKSGNSGGSNTFLSWARYNSDGSLDTSFDGDGKVTTDHGLINYLSVTEQTDGKILVAGSSFTGSSSTIDYGITFALMRYNPDGSLDTTFDPVDSVNNIPGYIAKGAAVVLDSTVQIYDAELAAQGHYAGASITLVRHDGANRQDVFSGSGNLSFTAKDAILSGVTIGTVSNSNGTLIINFNTNATQVRVNEALSSIAYSNTSNSPIASQQIDWIFNDGNTGTQGTGGALSVFGSTTVENPLITPAVINYIDTAFIDRFPTLQGSLAASSTPFTYGITGGTDYNDDFIIKTSAFGVLFVSKATGEYSFGADYAAIEALTVNTSINFTVTASDGVFSDSKTLTINITQSGNTESLGNDKLIGTSGNDSFDGLAGADIMKGGLGDDTYTVESKGDMVIEGAKAGNDTVISSITYTLKANVENLTLTGTVAIIGTGNSLANILTGNAQDNVLNGGAGADSLIGGLGDDVYIVDNINDAVIETSSLLSEIDTVKSSITYTLGSNVENLTLTGKAAINGSGNELSNILTGNNRANTLNGNDGNDILNGGLGNDVLTGGDGQDIFKLMNRSKDTITDFSVADDTIQLENSVFKKLITSGVLSANNFKVGTAATDVDDYVVYNSDTGALYYDANGNGAGGATQIALLGVHLELTNEDFVVI